MATAMLADLARADDGAIPENLWCRVAISAVGLACQSGRPSGPANGGASRWAAQH